jgi:hypothetical protein
MSCLNNYGVSALALGEENKKKNNRNKNYRSQIPIAEAAGITDVTLRLYEPVYLVDSADSSNAISANPGEEVRMELHSYRDRKHLDDVLDGPLFRQFTDLITPRSSCIMGEFSRLSA